MKLLKDPIKILFFKSKAPVTCWLSTNCGFLCGAFSPCSLSVSSGYSPKTCNHTVNWRRIWLKLTCVYVFCNGLAIC